MGLVRASRDLGEGIFDVLGHVEGNLSDMTNDEDRIARKLRREYESALVHLSNVVSIFSPFSSAYL